MSYIERLVPACSLVEISLTMAISLMNFTFKGLRHALDKLIITLQNSRSEKPLILLLDFRVLVKDFQVSSLISSCHN